MKKLVLFTALFSQILFAQQNDLAIDLQPVADSAVNWETTLTLDGQTGMENGLLIELPSGIRMAPVNATINDNQLFLQNSIEISEKESVLSWELSPEGILLRFQDGQYNQGDQLVLKLMMSKIKKRFTENPTINIRSVTNSQTLEYSDDIKASSVLALIAEN
jgi:hypothetical protein